MEILAPVINFNISQDTTCVGYTVDFTDDDQYLVVGASDGVRVYGVAEVLKGQFLSIETGSPIRTVTPAKWAKVVVFCGGDGLGRERFQLKKRGSEWEIVERTLFFMASSSLHNPTVAAR